MSGGGNDSVIGGTGDDYFEGGSGDDTLQSLEGNDTLLGDSGNDSLAGGSNNDFLNGGDDNDTLLGGLDDDSLFGGAGDDFLDGGEGRAGNDTLFGEDGKDTLYGGTGNNELYGGNGNDELFGAGGVNRFTFIINLSPPPNVGKDKLYGGYGDDTLNGLFEEDSLFGEQGNDSLVGGTGNDSLVGGTENDFLEGGDDNDTLEGGKGDDELFAGSGSDFLVGDGGNDILDGGEGIDVVSYETTDGIGISIALDGRFNEFGNFDGIDGLDRILNVENVFGSQYGDRIIGSNVTNVIVGKSGNDIISGLEGNDILIGEEGDDKIFGGEEDKSLFASGDDTLYGGLGADTLNGGDGKDLTYYTGSEQGVSVDLVAGTGSGGDAEGDELVSIEVLQGSHHDDTLIGNDEDNELYGLLGNDFLIGNGGADKIDGGDGTDTVSYESTQNSTGIGVLVFLDGGIDVDLPIGSRDGLGNLDSILNIENAIGSQYSDKIFGNSLANFIRGEDGNDTIGGSGGNDSFVGGKGADSLDGGDGNDIASYSDSEQGVSVDLTAGTGSGGEAEGDLLTSIETLFGSQYNDTLEGDDADNYLYGQNGNDLLIGNNGQDTILGGDGQDTVFGGGNDDVMDGGAGIDTMDVTWWDGAYELNMKTGVTNFIETAYNFENVNTGSGNDRIVGTNDNNIINTGAGDDVLVGGQRGDDVEIDSLTGGEGSDTFILGDYHGNMYSVAGDDDYALITDFEKGKDSVQLDLETYTLGTSPISGISGTAIYLSDELIGILEGVDQSNLVFEDASFTTTLKTKETEDIEGITESIVIEAEDLNLSTYLVENFSEIETNDDTQITIATGISLLNASENEGTASLLASDYNLSGTYDLSISYFDENDGEAQIQVLKNGSVVDEILLNENTSSGYPTEDTRREYVIENLDIASSDTLTIKGIAGISDQGSEWARVDFLSFALDTEITEAATSEV